jgi:hypothetical protein
MAQPCKAIEEESGRPVDPEPLTRLRFLFTRRNMRCLAAATEPLRTVVLDWDPRRAENQVRGADTGMEVTSTFKEIS